MSMRERMAAGYRASRLRTVDLVSGATDEQLATTVQACPDWTLHDLMSHLVGLATDLSSGGGPGDDTQAWVDGMVDVRRSVPVSEQLAEWETSGPAFEAVMLENARLGALLIDLVAHEHDIAQTLGVVGDRTAPELALSMTVQKMAVDDDLATHGLAAARMIGDDDEEWTYGTGDVEVELRASTFELFRLTGGRRTHEQILALDHDGDLERYLPGLVHLPAPERTYVE